MSDSENQELIGVIETAGQKIHGQLDAIADLLEAAVCTYGDYAKHQAAVQIFTALASRRDRLSDAVAENMAREAVNAVELLFKEFDLREPAYQLTAKGRALLDGSQTK